MKENTCDESSSKLFSLVYTDCPWPYNNEMSGQPKWGGRKYPSMSISDLKALGVREIAAKDSLLFMWATFPKLREAYEVMDAWGFEYTTNGFTWVKVNPKSGGWFSGIGHYTASNAEFVLIGKRGKGLRRINKSVKQVVDDGWDEVLVAPRGRHSAKPQAVRDRIVQLYGDVPRIELFARQRVEGWDAWGNEVESTVGVLPSSTLGSERPKIKKAPAGDNLLAWTDELA